MPQSNEKRIKELLRDPLGRAALERELGISITLPEERLLMPFEKPPAIVAVLVPCYDHPDPAMTDAYYKVTDHARKHTKAEIWPVPQKSASIITWVRNNLVQSLLSTRRAWTHALWWDDDIVPPTDALTKLLSHNKDVIVGLCTCRTDPPVPNIRYWRADNNRYEEIIGWEDGLVEVGAGGTGFMLVTKRALQEVAEAYFTCQVEKDLYGMPTELALEVGGKRRAHFDETGNCLWFRCLPYAQGYGEMGEDVSFCHVLRHYRGIKTYCDTTVQPDHVGKYEFGIKDFVPYRDSWIKEAKNAGHFVAKKEESTKVVTQ